MESGFVKAMYLILSRKFRRCRLILLRIIRILNSMNKWEKRFIQMAELVASWSKDPSTQCGCVISKGNRSISSGYNGYPIGVEDTIKDPREIKYEKTVHAEINAILFAKQDLTGCTLYVTPLPPCARCAAVIIQSGIKKVICTVKTKGDSVKKWEDSGYIAQQMFDEAGVELVVIKK